MMQYSAEVRRWQLPDRGLPLGPRTLIMGIVNVTPDSFSDGGQHFRPESAIEHALRLETEGADVLDIGGESTRPGSEPVSVEEELRRVLPVMEELRRASKLPLSIDTRKAEVAGQALAAGASIVNDVTALGDPAMAGVVASTRAGVVLMHMRGDPKTMQQTPTYEDVVEEVCAFLETQVQVARAAGIRQDAIVLDPGLGFGKRTGRGVEDNVTLLRGLDRLVRLGYPVLVGASRKTFVGNLLGGRAVHERLEGSLAAAGYAVLRGARIARVHDVQATRRFLDVIDALRATDEPNP